MKKTMLIMLALLCFTGCGSLAKAEEQEIVSFSYQNIRMTPHGEAAPVIAALGEPKTYTEEASCAFDGLDKTYYYGPFYFTTYPLDGKDYIHTLWFADDTVATEEGIRIGSTQELVEEAYGKAAFNGTNAYILVKGNSKLTVVITEGTVSNIRYDGMLD